MKHSILFLLLFIWVESKAQLNKKAGSSYFDSEKYLSFNPFALLEGGMAVGVGFGNRFSERSEYFTELSYVTKNPLYPDYVNSLHGFRFITQYRYHFLQQWKPILNFGFQRRRARTNPFAGLELRLKDFNFSNTNSFIKTVTSDTLHNYLYKANATCVAGAIIFGSTYDIGASGNWKIEITVGVGAKQKLVKFKNLSEGYEPIKIQAIDWGFVPKIYESGSSVYIPFALRLRYIIN